ncbi:MAG: hypothetical protein C0404_00390 [Verrucomicrobia bacterium]|nr:hypothetical protein [Verrucomicrobiota bacterium]
MRVALDARWIYSEISGIGSYTRELVRHLSLVDRTNAYTLLFDSEILRDRTIAELALSEAHNFEARLVPWGIFSIRNQLLLPDWLLRAEINVFHSTNYMIPFRAFPRTGPRSTACVCTVHDVIPLKFPQFVPKSKKARLFFIFKWVMRQAGLRADAIITVSNSSREDTILHLGIPDANAAKVRTIYNGVSDRFKPEGSRSFEKPVDATRTLLYVGRSDPYKNLTTLIRAIAEYRKMPAPPVVLTIAGSPDPRYPEAQQLASGLGLNDIVRWTGYLSDDALLKLYQEADLLVHPSIYEGFGLQVVEAMACGTPVICSNAASLPEVAGDAAIMLDPMDTAGFAAKIREVLGNPALAKQMSDKGLLRAAKFTWNRCASETMAVYESVARSRNAS